MWLPKINFVDEMSLQSLRKCKLIGNRIMLGHINYDTNIINIVKINRKHNTLVLLHEMTHWILYKIFRQKKNGALHRLLDKHCSGPRPGDDQRSIILQRQRAKLNLKGKENE